MVGFPYQVPVPGVVVKIYKTPTARGYDSFTIVYRQHGKRTREVLSDPEKAKTRGKQIADSLATGRMQAADMSMDDREAYMHAKELLKPSGVALAAACKEYAECNAMLGGVPLIQAVRDFVKRDGQVSEKRTVGEVVGEFLEAKRQGQATKIRGKAKKIGEKYLYQMERRLKPFSDTFKTYIAALSGEDINAFVQGLKVDGRTKNNYIGDIRALFEFAKLKRYVSRDHHELDAVQSAAESDLEIEIFTPSELAKLLANAREDLIPVLALGAFSGMRTSEILRTDWSKVHFKTGMIETLGKVHKKHGRARRLIPIQSNLAALLQPYAKRTGKVWTFCEQTLYDVIGVACDAAGIKWKANGLRDSYISYRLAVVKSADQVALEAGNSPQMIFEHYRQLDLLNDATAWFSIGLPNAAKVPVSRSAP